MDLQTVSAKTVPAIRRCQQKGGLGSFAQQFAMVTLLPIVTYMASNLLNRKLPRLTGQTGDKFSSGVRRRRGFTP